MKNVELSEIYNVVALHYKKSVNDNNEIHLVRKDTLEPQNIYDDIYALLFVNYNLKKQVETYRDYFDNGYNPVRAERLLKKFNECLGNEAKIFQQALFVSIMININKVIEMIASINRKKYDGERYELNIENEWSLYKSDNEKFNKFIKENYFISRKKRNKYYVHEELIPLPEEIVNYIKGFTKLQNTILKLVNYDDKELQSIISESNKSIDVVWELLPKYQ